MLLDVQGLIQKAALVVGALAHQRLNSQPPALLSLAVASYSLRIGQAALTLTLLITPPEFLTAFSQISRSPGSARSAGIARYEVHDSCRFCAVNPGVAPRPSV